MRAEIAGKGGTGLKAYVLHEIGELRYEDRPLPEIRPGWALVKVLAAGICSSDIPRIFEKGTYHFPTIPGHEFSGQVEKAANESDGKWVGKRVGVFPLIPCKKCPSCQKGQYETCTNYDYIGSRRDGGFAEYVAVPVWNLEFLLRRRGQRLGGYAAGPGGRQAENRRNRHARIRRGGPSQGPGNHAEQIGADLQSVTSI